MDRAEEELEQLASWLSEEGLAPDSSKEDQLCLLWSALQRTRGRLHSVTWDLDSQRSQHLAEMAEVRKSLEQIRILTEHKDVLAQEIQDENDQLKDQLQRLVSLQDSQISEVAKMLYQQGLTDLIHSSPSEQVAYLLVERASLLEDPNNLTGDGNPVGRLGTEESTISAHQLTHKGAPRHGHSPWKRLFGLHKAAQSKHTFIPDEARHLTGEANSVERECYRLERDLEEGSRRLAMAHSEIRRLTDELESAHLTQRAYEPELQAAQQEVEQLRQEVQKLKKYEIVELRKAKELNDRLDLEIRALRSRVRTLDAEKTSMQQMAVSLQKKVERLESQLTEQVQNDQTTELTEVASLRGEVKLQESAVHELQQQHAVQVQANVSSQVVSLQREVERLESALQEQQLLLLTEQLQAKELAKSQEAELIQKNVICRDLQTKLSAQSRSLLEMESEINSLKQLLDTSRQDLDNLYAIKENNVQNQKLWNQKEQHCENCRLKCDIEPQTQLQLNKENTLCKEVPDYQEAVKSLLATQHECDTLKKEICETLKCLDKERSKYHELKEKHKVKLCRAKQRCDDETTWRDEKIKSLERELSLCSHSVAKEKELTISITMENEKLLRERRTLLEQLKEEEHKKKDCNLTAALSKCRVDFLEMENKKLGNKIIHMSNQLAVLERSQQNTQAVHFSEELKKTSNLMQVFKSLPVQTSSMTMPELSEIQGLLDNAQRKQADVTSSTHGFNSGPLPLLAETGYLNLTSAQTLSDPSTPPAPLSNSDSTCS